MTSPPVEIVGLGTILIDHLVVLPAHPEIDSKTPVVEDRFQVGGPVPTALAMLRRLGRPCAFVGSWGSDAFGSIIDEDLRQEGIDSNSSIRRAAAGTGFAHVWVCRESARRTIAYRRPAEPVTPDEFNRDLLRRARVLHLDGWPTETALAAAKWAQQENTLVALDAGSPKPGIEQLIRHVDVLNAPRRFVQQFLATDDIPRAIDRLLRMGPRIVTVTSGAEGAALGTGDTYLELPAFEVDAVDTTGAGDVFTGALIHAALEAVPPAQMLSFAMASAALKCQGLGNREPLPTLEAIQALLNTQTLDSRCA